MTGLRTRPSAETFPLDDLVEFARRGRLRVPSFQRGLRWTRSDVVKLFDSVLKGYPVGSLLLWERDAPAESVTLGPLKIDAPAGPAYYVVDGQQRITALAAALSEQGESDPRFAIGYDLDDDEFTPRPTRAGESWIPTHVLYDLTTLLLWFRDRPEQMDRFDAAAAVSKALRDLRLPAYVVRQDDEEVLRGIFDRMNTAGKKLTRGEVFAALRRSDGTRDETTLSSVAEQVQLQTGFGVLDESAVMQVILARRGADVRREIRNEFETTARGRDPFAAREPEDEAYRLGADAAVLAVEFVQRVVRVPHQALLPYQYPLITLARFFAHHPHPAPRHERLLRRFFWRAVVKGPGLVRGNTTGVSRMLNRRVVPEDEVASITGLMTTVAGDRPAYPPVDPLRTNSAASKMLLCAMWGHGPRSLTDGSCVEVEDLRGVLADHQTAADVVVPILVGRRAAGHDRDAGNRLLLVPLEDRESDAIEALSGATADVLTSHLLEPEDVTAMSNGDALRSVQGRTERLEQLLRVFLDRMCEWEQEDTPDLEMLVGAEEAAGASV